MNETSKNFIQISENVCVLHPSVGADTSAVLGAKVSRAPNIRERWDELVTMAGAENWDISDPPQGVRDFIAQWVGTDNPHSSIVEMAGGPWVYCDGFGPWSAWLLEDFPLFKGQETSTRAVDMTKFPGSELPCLGAPDEAVSLHTRWMDLFKSLRENGLKRGGYKFDDIRWALPCTYRTGVVLTSPVRDAVRHLRQIRLLDERLAEQVMSGYKALSPIMTQNYDRGHTFMPSNWTVKSPAVGDYSNYWLLGVGGPQYTLNLQIEDGADIFGGSKDRPARQRIQTYADPAWESEARFKVTIDCSVAAARDWHRHRPVMPWFITLPRAERSGRIATVPWTSPLYDQNLSAAERSGNDLWLDTCAAVNKAIVNNVLPWKYLHLLTLGTQIRLECVATLPKLLYMLELRALQPGANFEYQRQATAGLFQLTSLLRPEVVKKLLIREAYNKAVIASGMTQQSISHMESTLSKPRNNLEMK